MIFANFRKFCRKNLPNLTIFTGIVHFSSNLVSLQSWLKNFSHSSVFANFRRSCRKNMPIFTEILHFSSKVNLLILKNFPNRVKKSILRYFRITKQKNDFFFSSFRRSDTSQRVVRRRRDLIKILEKKKTFPSSSSSPQTS